MLDFLAKLQRIDRRWLYLALAAACALPFVLPVRLPVYVSPETRDLYETVDKCPPNKVVIIDSSWDAGSLGENWGQVEVVFEHLFRKNVKFVVISLDMTPMGPQFADKVINKLVREKFPNKKYGVDWVNLGFTKGDWQAMQQIARDIRRQYPQDSRGYSLDDAKHLPIMQHVHNIDDVHMIYSVTYSPMENWIPFIHGVYGTPIGFGCAGIQSTTYYRYILAHQLSGMLVGVRGAAEYDALLNSDIKKRTSLGTQLIVPQAFGHAVIIFAVILGNIGYFASRRKGR